jgi:multidrug efflux system membrane fusion protein
MKRRLPLMFVALIVLVAIAAAWIVHHVRNAPSGVPASRPIAAQGVQTVNGETVVAIAPEAQRAGGIDVAPLAPSTFQAERFAFATAVDLQLLFDLSNRLAAARAERDSARAHADASQAQYERARSLYQDDRNVSLKSVQDAQAAARSDWARFHASEAVQGGQEASVRQQFGESLASAAAAPSSALFRQLSSGRATVLRITLPEGGNRQAPAHITVDQPEGHAIAARKLSVSPQTDPAFQGFSYFYVAEGALAAGTRTAAHIALDGKSPTGLLIPDSAIVWYGGQRWIYVRTAPDRFTRRQVSSASATNEGVLSTGGFRAGDKVVVRGAQLLLSEEQRPQGIATQCKDPPECDD